MVKEAEIYIELCKMDDINFNNFIGYGRKIRRFFKNGGYNRKRRTNSLPLGRTPVGERLVKAEEFYKRSAQAEFKLVPLHFKLIEEIKAFDPYYIFEFGCGYGKILQALKRNSNLKVSGVDINETHVEVARLVGLNVELGDEKFLDELDNSSFDVVFTCSVLDHIKEVGSIINNLERIAKRVVILCETNSPTSAMYYYSHAYQTKFDYEKKEYQYKSPIDHCTYEIWVKELD